MVFPSPPLFLDPPNWNHQHQGGELHQIQISQQPPPPPPCPDGGSRPSSMSDRARQAKLPQPEAALKCPRCDSANTKFCYFNNYSLTQPRHFCKTCRRYWTRGGALRNVPVGGGSRRNKRSKSGGGGGGPKSQSSGTSSSSSAAANNNINMINIPQLHAPQMAPPFMASLYHAMPEVGMSFPDIQQAAGEEEQWRRIQQIQQFPFLGGLEAPPMGPAPVSGSYSFDGEGGGIVTQMASVKMEDRHPGLNLQRQFLGIPRNDQYWGGGNGSNGGGGGGSSGGGGGGWMMDLSCFNASSSGNPL